ncbi:MAG: hypothetical protein GY795_18355 [Desulfobacterales bacterium]|nr:hypothetical protein [Desulfobacterales bacterium]
MPMTKREKELRAELAEINETLDKYHVAQGAHKRKRYEAQHEINVLKSKQERAQLHKTAIEKQLTEELDWITNPPYIPFHKDVKPMEVTGIFAGKDKEIKGTLDAFDASGDDAIPYRVFIDKEKGTEWCTSIKVEKSVYEKYCTNIEKANNPESATVKICLTAAEINGIKARACGEKRKNPHFVVLDWML